MEFNSSLRYRLKLAINFIVYRIQQSMLTTTEYEIAHTTCGRVRGLKRKNMYSDEHSYYAFEGIPFAKPPLGALRFRAPQAPEPWKGVLECTQYKPKPTQYKISFNVVEGSEDCLYLNVYAKKLSTTKPLPVMVWIYGGGFNVGEASRDLYSPEYFMQRDVVLVVITYRLGVFGFLCFDSPDVNVPGNAGLKDQVMALKWVKDNIRNFNGDPRNVTVFGESAGGVSTHMLMLTPRAEGLFHKAIIQSGSALCPWGLTDRHDWGYKLARHLGYKGANKDLDVYRYLSKQSSRRLMGKYRLLLDKKDLLMDSMFVAFGPVVEPYETPDCITTKTYKELLPMAWGNKIPLIIGGNANEGLFYHNMTEKYPFLVNDLNGIGFINLIPEEIRRSHDASELEDMGRQLQAMYFKGEIPNFRDHLHKYLQLMGDKLFWQPMYRTLIARCEYAPDVPTYCYYFNFDSPTFNHSRPLLCSDLNVRGTCHADDLSYLFGNFLAEKLSPTRSEYRCIQRMISMWSTFALTSDPNCKEIAPTIWKWVDDVRKPIQCLDINDSVKFVNLPIDERLRKWSEFYTKVSQI